MVGEQHELGFTGTRHGMTKMQFRAVHDHLQLIVHRLVTLHHGDCIGSDEEMHGIGRKVGLYIVGHPPLNPKARAWCACDTLCPELDYIPRNHAIVDVCDELLATPRGDTITRGSGTWSTILYARRQHRMVTIVYPDGSFAFEP